MNKEETYVYLIRHGETIWNKSQRLQGRQNIPLSNKGLEQAQMMARRCGHLSIDLVGTSPLLRAQQTGTIIADHLNVPCLTIPDLKARAYGPWEGKSISTIRKEFHDLFQKMRHWTLQQIFSEQPLRSIESYQTVSERTISFLKKTGQTNPGKNMLMVTHSGVITSVLLALQFPTEEIPLIEHHGIVKLCYWNDELTIERVTGLIDPKQFARPNKASNERVFLF